jgi:hypothetical protein
MSRGRGRGRGGRGSVTQDIVRDNYEDLGLEAFHNVDDKVPPPLFPPLEVPVPLAISATDRYLITKMRENSFRFN